MNSRLSTPSRSIVHLDADAFFASVEQAADARLRGKPVAVGGEKRGIIASASYEARRFGIYTPMPTILARRLCPKLVVLPGDFDKYELFSRLMFSYAYDFTPDVEIGSIDEGYFDLTGARKPALSIAETIRGAIRQSLKLSVSEGIAVNKLVSQIASKLNKPAAFQFVPPGHEAGFLDPLANQWLPGIGPKTATQLNAAGLARIGQIARTPVDLLGLLVGRMAPQLRSFALGIDGRPVVPARAPAKSYSEQETFAADTTDEEFIEATLRRMADKLMAKVRADGKSIRTLTVKVRYNDMDEEQAGESLAEPTDLETEIYSRVSLLLRRTWRRRVSLRLVSLKLTNIYDGPFRGGLALDAAVYRHDAQQRLAGVVDNLRQKYGRSVLLRGHDFVLRAGNKTAPSSSQASGSADIPVRPSVSGRQEADRNVRAPISSVSASRGPRPTQHIPLNVHSYYSFLDSTLSIAAIIDWAKEHELPAIALTDRNNLHGAVEFAQAAAQAGIKPIIGAELQWRNRRICLYVENQAGYHNLCRILNSLALPGAPAFLPASRWLSEPAGKTKCRGQSAEDKGLGAGAPSAALLADRTDGLLALSSSAELAPFFPGRFYLEINHPDAFKGSSLPGVVSAPVHYARPSDRWKYDVVQSIRTLTLLRQRHPEKRLEGEYHFRSAAEWRRLFAARPELLARSQEIADRCSFVFSLGKPQFPGYRPPDGAAPAVFLRQLAMAGLRRRYPQTHVRLKAQVEEELAIITEVGYEEYFLVMWDILQECGRRGIAWITRGSAADSLVCYCLGISDVCPIRFDLYFRRFLNKERMALSKLPDIDVDFAHDRKDEVIDLIFEKYGPAHAAIVGGFSTFQSRSAFAETAKVLGVSEFQVRRITERLPHFSSPSGLPEAAAQTLECRSLPLDQEPYSTALEMAQFLDGFPRYPKMHPCGLVLSRQPMDEITPCFVSAKGYPTTHFDMDSIEAVGLVKMDILAQGGLAVMRDVAAMVPEFQFQSSFVPSIPHRSRGLTGVWPSSHPGGMAEGSRGSKLSETLGIAPMENCTPKGCQNAEPKAVTYLSSTPPGCRANASLNRGSPPSSDPRLPSASPPGWNSQLSILNPQLSPISPLGPWDDPQVWDMIASGSARAVHHIESPAMISLCRMCNVRDIDTLIAIVSVIRPGAANESKKIEFARRCQGLSPVRYPHPSLESCLRSTFGLVVYEEHILQICEAFAGLPPGRADVLRRALGKEKDELIAQIETEFIACARRHGRTEAEITEVWGLVAGFRGYAFCKAHSTAYGVEAYQSAWLKLHYPAEFMAAVLTNGKGFYHPLVYVLECHRLGIPLLSPSINEPGPQFTVWDGRIRVPLLRVKGLTERTSEAILRERTRGEFASLSDFFLRVQPLLEEMESLIRVGAFDVFGKTRTTQYWEFKALAASEVKSQGTGARSQEPGVRRQKQGTPASLPLSSALCPPLPRHSSAAAGHFVSPASSEGHQLAGKDAGAPGACRVAPNSQPSTFNQLWLFPPDNLDHLPSVPLAEPDRLQRLRWEEELLGFPASGHPLELFPDIAWDTYCLVNQLGQHVGKQVVTCGLVIEQRLFHQANGEPMKFLTLADWTGIVETELFARTYQSYGLTTIRYRVLEIAATVEPFENGRGYTLRVLRAGKPRTNTIKRAPAHE